LAFRIVIVVDPRFAKAFNSLSWVRNGGFVMDISPLFEAMTSLTLSIEGDTFRRQRMGWDVPCVTGY